jgi:signal peptidase II
MPWTRKACLFWPLATSVLLADCASKRIAETALTPAHVPHWLFGEIARLTLAYNPGAAMSLSLGPYSRLGFSLLAVAALVLLAGLYRRLPRGAELATAGMALVAGGALGNALDRLRSARGVVDFIDVGIGAARVTCSATGVERVAVLPDARRSQPGRLNHGRDRRGNGDLRDPDLGGLEPQVEQLAGAHGTSAHCGPNQPATRHAGRRVYRGHCDDLGWPLATVHLPGTPKLASGISGPPAAAGQLHPERAGAPARSPTGSPRRGHAGRPADARAGGSPWCSCGAALADVELAIVLVVFGLMMLKPF